VGFCGRLDGEGGFGVGLRNEAARAESVIRDSCIDVAD